MPSLKKLRRLAAEKAKLAETLAAGSENGGGSGVPMLLQVAINSAVANYPVIEEGSFLESEQKSDYGATETGVSPISHGSPNGAILSQNAPVPGNDATNESNGLKTAGTASIEPVLVRVYGKPINPRIRFIEFEDGSHGRLWVNMNAQPMIGWTVWVKPYADIPGDYEMHGRYNSMGVRRS